MLFFRTNARLRAEYKHLAYEAEGALSALERQRDRAIKRAVQLEADLLTAQAALHAATTLADKRAVTIGSQAVVIRNLETKLEPFTKRWKRKG